MNRSKLLSRIFFYISRIIAVSYLAAGLYSIFCIVTKFCVREYASGNYLQIHYPFTQFSIFNIDNNLPYIIFSFLIPIILYGVFFWLASNTFRAFFQQKLFTHDNILHLKRFYLFNLFVPVAATATGGLFVAVELVIWYLIIVHLILGIFVYFMAAMFKQGLNLQHEQELFI